MVVPELFDLVYVIAAEQQLRGPHYLALEGGGVATSEAGHPVKEH